MSNEEPEQFETTPIDPRLKSFLRKAGAIIAAEKGLNSASRIKLESLAEHVKLPQPLFDEALVRLQSNDTVNLTHYEKAFMKFLDKEFGKIKGGVLSLGMEKRAIERAESKYQINGTRAEQLIESQAQSTGVSRISPDEAATFAEQIIVDRVNTQTVVEDELRNQLYKIGEKWAYSRNQVDRIIFRQISGNRKKKNSALLKSGAVWSAILLMAGLGVAYSLGWINLTGESEIAKPSPKIGLAKTKTNQPATTFEQLQAVAKPDAALDQWVTKIGGTNSTQRILGYQQLARTLCLSDRFDQTDLSNLVQKLYYEEQSDDAADEILQVIQSRLEPNAIAGNRSGTSLKSAYRANALLGQLCFSPVHSTHKNTIRQLAARKTISELVQVPIGDDQQLVDYIKRSETAIATDQWNKLIQSTWNSPASSSMSYHVIDGITQEKIDDQTLNSYRDQALVSIIKADDSQWNSIRKPIEKTLTDCDEARLSQWISAYLDSKNESFQEFAGPILAKRIKVQSRTDSRKDIFDAISKHDEDIKNQLLRPVVSRNEVLEIAVTELLNRKLSQSSRATPDQIAHVAMSVNQAMSFCNSIENATKIDDATFAKFDRLIALEDPLLRKIVSLPIDRRQGQSRKAIIPTSSDNARKNSALKRLSSLDTDESGLRKLALDQLARVAVRFDRITYSESETLANYLLAGLGTDEFLNAQQRIEAFSKWPNLALSIADKLPQSSVSTDQALTVARLLLGKEFEPSSDENWKQQLQSQMYDTIRSDIKNQVALDPNNVKSDWNRLEIYLTDTYQNRLMIVQNKEFPGAPFRGPAEASLALLNAFSQSATNSRSREFGQASTVVTQSATNDIARVVLANQFLMKWTAESILGDLATQAKKRLKEFEDQADQHTLVGEQLYFSELTLLQLFDLKRKSLVEKLIKSRR